MDIQIINNAIEKHLTIGPSENWHYKERIETQYGNDVYKIISEIIVFSTTIQPDWNIESYEDYLKRVHILIENKFPLLSKEAINILTNRVAYDWK